MIWIALAYHLASRLAYVLYVGLTLKRQDRTACLTRRYGVEAGFQRFRRVAAFVMANDAVSLAILCLVSADTLRVGLPRGLAIAVGAVLVVVGVSTKVWAARTLRDGYYWRNFFAPDGQVVPTTAGPYRWLRNPMYTIGYLPVFGPGTRSPGPRSVNTFSFFFFERNRARRMKRVSSTVCRSPSKSARHSSAPRPAKITANSSPP